MIAIEIEAPIVDHRLDIRSLLLPANADRAKVIVMFEETPARLPGADVLALARAAQASFPRQSSESLAQAMKEMRDEWSRDL